jgi:hypothetical protein
MLESLYVRWITSCGITFRMVTIPSFRDLLPYLNPAIDNHLPTTVKTIREWVIRQYDAEKDRVRQKLQSALSKIHFTVDLWTSPNHLAILGIIGHCIIEIGDLEHFVLALRELDGEHTGANQAKEVMEVINDYGIASKVGYFVMDNASNNDTLIECLSECMYFRFR